ncbi:MAG: hypothetical protein ACXVBW_07510, partial [Bdellovibrionota bacterium]
MKNLAPISFCLVLASLISGCDPTLSTMAKGASKELGTPFSVRTDDSDECATKQLAILTRDYLALDAVTKDQIKAQLKAYESVIIEASLSTGSHFRQVAVVLEPNSQFGFGYDSDNGHYPIAGNT